MKSTIITLLKFNIAMGILTFIFGLIFQESVFRENAFALTTLLAMFATWFIGNMAILLRARKAITNSIKEGVLEAAATAIQFQEAAKKRAHERMEGKRVDPEHEA